MKLSLIALAILTATTASYAGDLVLVQLSNGHGQSTPLYTKAAPPSVALYSSKVATGATAVKATQLNLASRANGHGQDALQFVRE